MATRGSEVVLFGGCSDWACFDDIWEWDGVSWTRKIPLDRRPWFPWLRADGKMARLGSKLVLFGGWRETWEWDGVSWTKKGFAQFGPEQRNRHAMATLSDKVVLFGGLQHLDHYTNHYGELLSDTWEWDGVAWVKKTPAVSPPPRQGHAMATLGSKVVLFGGNTSSGFLGDTWEWDGVAWVKKTPAVSPPPRWLHAMATLGNKVVLFGGCCDTGETGESTFFGDTWEWDGVTWTQKQPASSPERRSDHAMAAVGSRVVLFGGWGDRRFLSDTWEWDGMTWTQRTP
jgi:N-acetylneuraminic acid mutarotase